jgi:hypothetical protein
VNGVKIEMIAGGRKNAAPTKKTAEVRVIAAEKSCAKAPAKEARKRRAAKDLVTEARTEKSLAIVIE